MKLKKLMKQVNNTEIVRITDYDGGEYVGNKVFYTNHYSGDAKIDIIYVNDHGTLTVRVK